MRILILGGTGAMGKWLVEILATEGHEVYVTSRNAYASKRENVCYLQGDAHDDKFLSEILKKGYDAIVDFMVYDTIQFKNKIPLLFSGPWQYVFLSSSRVYANSKEPLKESSTRLIDTVYDTTYLCEEEYPLYKAREEDLLRESGHNNWTIIRPYITYSNERLQLGTMEKERWLYRALKGRTICFSNDVANCVTSLTYGEDVAKGISAIIGNHNAYGEAFHIVSPENTTWNSVLNIYLDEIEKKTGTRPKVLMLDSGIRNSIELGYYCQYRYDRLCNRVFDSGKIGDICSVDYCSVEDGLRTCLSEFIDNGCNFRSVDWKYEAYIDRLTKEITPLSEIPTVKRKIKYLFFRFSPYFRWNSLKLHFISLLNCVLRGKNCE